MKKIIFELITFIPILGIWEAAYSLEGWVKSIVLLVSVTFLSVWKYYRGRKSVEELYKV